MNDLYRPTGLRPRCRSVLPTWKLAAVAAVAVLGLPQALPSDAIAQSLKADFTVREWLEYDDNTLLTRQDPKSVLGSTTSPQLKLSAETPTVSSDLTGRVDLRLFDDSQFNSTDFHLKSDNTLRGEVTELGLDAAVDYDTVRTSELDSGVRVVSGVDRFRWNVRPGFSYSLTPTDRVAATANYNRTEYLSDDSNEFIDFQTFSLNPEIRHAFGPLDTGFVMVMTDRYETLEGPSVTIDTVGPVAGWTHRWNELIEIGGYVGWRVSFSKLEGRSTETSNGLSANLSWTYRDEADRFSVRAGRSISPLSNGTQVQSDTVSGSWNHRINERISTTLDAYLRHNSDLDGGDGNDSTYFQVWPKLQYDLTENWNLTPSYRYRTISRDDGNDADSHAFLVNITYDLDTFDVN